MYGRIVEFGKALRHINSERTRLMLSGDISIQGHGELGAAIESAERLVKYAALDFEEVAPSASANSGITQGAKAQTAVLLMDKLFERWQQSAEWGGLAAEVMREWEACCYCDKTAAS